MKQKILYLLMLITFMGFLIRVYNISTIPSGLFCDEASTGYNAYLIYKTGHDEYGKALPVFFQSFGNFRPGVPFYTTIPFVAVFGLSEFSTRLPSVFIGTATIIALFFLIRILFRSDKIALLSAFLLAISPWHIHFSRYGAENIYLPLFIVLGSLLFIGGVTNKSHKMFVGSFIVFGIGLYTYFQAYFLIPLFLIFLLIQYKKHLNRKLTVIGIISFCFISLPLLFGLQTGETLGRLTQVATANDQKPLGIILSGMVTTYKDHFLPEFLFSKGDIGYHTHFITRFSVRGMGQLYWIQLPFILMSFVFFKKYKAAFLYILFWIALYPLGSTIAPFADGGGPFATRSIIGVIPFQVLTAIGLVACISYIKHRKAKIILCIIIAFFIGYSVKFYLTEYFIRYPLYSSNFWGWQYGPKDIINYFNMHETQYDDLVMQGEFNAPHIFFRFYSPEGCTKCILGTPDTLFSPTRKQLFAVTPAYILAHPEYKYFLKKTLYYPNGEEAFIITTVEKL